MLGTVDAVVFTAGVGENAASVRAASLSGLERLGIAVDPDRNAGGSGPRVVSPDGSDVAVLVVPTDEEWEIARQAVEVVSAAGGIAPALPRLGRLSVRFMPPGLTLRRCERPHAERRLTDRRTTRSGHPYAGWPLRGSTAPPSTRTRCPP